MSQNDNFIDEVTEEVRKDKLFILLKRYGWIGLLFILLIVAGSIIVEIRSSQRNTASRELGDALSKLILEESQKNTDEKAAKNQDVLKETLISTLVKARVKEVSGDKKQAINIYRDIASLNQSSQFADFAKFKLVLLLDQNFEEKSNLLEELISPDSAFFLLAIEQKVLLNLSKGNVDLVKEDMALILNDPKASPLLRSRINKLKKVLNLGD